MVVRLLCARDTIVGMEETFPGADVRLHFVVRVAEHLLPAGGVDDGAGLEIPVPDALLRTGEREREPLLALAQRRFRLLAPRLMSRTIT